jgi:eukaryotic-like serine/threonine-protein kinase
MAKADSSARAWATPESAGEPRRPRVRVGDILVGKYRVDGILGEGGMGVVVEARHLKLDERVAIKILLPETQGDFEAVPRFEDEARATARIRSEHVAKVTDLGALEDGTPYMVMECLDGEDLVSWARHKGQVPVEEAVEVILQTCEVLVEAHRLGIIHRDLKPANLFCAERPDQSLCIKVLDFGISKIRGSSLAASTLSLTNPGMVMGSPIYMSPEQMESAGDVDERTDIWALGVILYELLLGSVPFSGETLAEVRHNIAHQATPRIRSFRSDTSAALERVISKCLEKDRTRRYANAAELAVALAPFGPHRAASISWAQSFRASGTAWRWVHISGLAAGALTALAIVAICLARAVSPISGGAETDMPVLSGPSVPAPGACAPPTLEAANPQPPPEEADKTPPSRPECTLNLNSIPVSNVVLDGTSIGRTPKVGWLASPGAHTVMFEHPEYGQLVTSVTCRAGDSKLVAVRLNRTLAAATGPQ